MGLIFEEKDIDAPAGTSTGTEIAAFVHDAKALHEEVCRYAAELKGSQCDSQRVGPVS
ncbi:MAG: hypothetical protein ACPIOQ_47415 [Promethearchaeia archaeon]